VNGRIFFIYLVCLPGMHVGSCSFLDVYTAKSLGDATSSAFSTSHFTNLYISRVVTTDFRELKRMTVGVVRIYSTQIFPVEELM
jgi:hypothetical protein